MGTCCSNPSEPDNGCPDTCMYGQNKSMPIFEQSPADVHSKTAIIGKSEAKSSHVKTKCSFEKYKHVHAVPNHLSSTERPSHLKLAKGPQPKVMIDEEKIKQSIYRKMRLCSEVALIGTGGAKITAVVPVKATGSKSCIVPKGKVNVNRTLKSSSHKCSTKLSPKSSICSIDSEASTHSVNFSIRSTSSEYDKKNSNIEDEI